MVAAAAVMLQVLNGTTSEFDTHLQFVQQQSMVLRRFGQLYSGMYI